MSLALLLEHVPGILAPFLACPWRSRVESSPLELSGVKSSSLEPFKACPWRFGVKSSALMLFGVEEIVLEILENEAQNRPK